LKPATIQGAFSQSLPLSLSFVKSCPAPLFMRTRIHTGWRRFDVLQQIRVVPVPPGGALTVCGLAVMVAEAGGGIAQETALGHCPAHDVLQAKPTGICGYGHNAPQAMTSCSAEEKDVGSSAHDTISTASPIKKLLITCFPFDDNAIAQTPPEAVSLEIVSCPDSPERRSWPAPMTRNARISPEPPGPHIT
jgi:hypothetical protein